MKIDTKHLGEVEINEAEIITFSNGLPGFPTETKYTLIGLDPELPIALLQSVENAATSFIVALPFAFKPDYVFDLSEEDMEQLQVTSEQYISTYTIMTLKDSLAESTLNLLAPIVINTKEKLGKQIVLQDSEQYPLRFPLGVFEGSVK